MNTQTLEEFGPIDVVVIGYPAGAPMTGSAAQILLDEVDKGTISVLDAPCRIDRLPSPAGVLPAALDNADVRGATELRAPHIGV